MPYTTAGPVLWDEYAYGNVDLTDPGQGNSVSQIFPVGKYFSISSCSKPFLLMKSNSPMQKNKLWTSKKKNNKDIFRALFDSR